MTHKHKKPTSAWHKKSHQLTKQHKLTTNLNKSHPKRELISIHQLSKIAMTFWIGGSCMVGMVIFPLLFKSMDQVTASQLVGQILNILAYIGLICLIIALIEVIINHKFALLKTKRFWYIIAMDFIVIVNNFAIVPAIYDLKRGLSRIAHQIIEVQSNVFDFWHSLSSILFMLTCAIGILYLIEI